MKSALIIILTILAYLTFASAAPNLSTTTAVIPYPEFKALLAARQPSAEIPKPPVPWAISQIHVVLAPVTGYTTLDIVVSGFTLSKGYHFIPVICGDLSLASAESGNCQPIHQPTGVTLLTEDTGAFTAAPTLHAPDLTPAGSSFTVENINAVPFHVTLPDPPPFPLSATSPKPGTLTFRHSSSAETTSRTTNNLPPKSTTSAKA